MWGGVRLLPGLGHHGPLRATGTVLDGRATTHGVLRRRHGQRASGRCGSIRCVIVKKPYYVGPNYAASTAGGSGLNSISGLDDAARRDDQPTADQWTEYGEDRRLVCAGENAPVDQVLGYRHAPPITSSSRRSGSGSVASNSTSSSRRRCWTSAASAAFTVSFLVRVPRSCAASQSARHPHRPVFSTCANVHLIHQREVIVYDAALPVSSGAPRRTPRSRRGRTPPGRARRRRSAP